MLEKYTFEQHNQTDMSVFNCGAEDCIPAHSWGPGIRGHFILHMVIAGKGFFRTKDQNYQVEAGSLFLISPNELAEYQADLIHPWSYVWVGFYGLMAENLCREAGLSSKVPVCSPKNSTKLANKVRNMLRYNGGSRQHELMRLSLLYDFFAELIEQAGDKSLSVETRQSEYLRQAIRYIENSYADSISVSGIAAHVGLDRSYLYSLFQRYLKITPKAYLTRFRMNKAEELLHTSLSVGEIAHSVGYGDALLFSKAFKKENGKTPSNYRRSLEKIL